MGVPELLLDEIHLLIKLAGSLIIMTRQLHTYIIMEHVRGGELLDRIREKKIFSEAEAVRIMRQLISALSFLHSRFGLPPSLDIRHL